MAPPATDNKDEKSPEDGPRRFKFPSHQSHMLNLAKMCQENSDYTDCVIQCGDFSSDDGEVEHERNRLRAHRLVLGSASSFLKNVFRDIPQSLPEATILVPGVKRNVCQALLDFLYTGEMKVYREDTSDLQLLIETLQIDPELISVDVIKGTKQAQVSNNGNSSNLAENEERKEEKTSDTNGESQNIVERLDTNAESTLEVAESNSTCDSNNSTKSKEETKKVEENNDNLLNPRKRKVSDEQNKTIEQSSELGTDVKISKLSTNAENNS